jgi:sugar lactone lactonase YvrE
MLGADWASAGDEESTMRARSACSWSLALLAVTIARPAAAELEVLAEFDQRPGNPAVGADGTIFVSMHPFDAPEIKVVRMDGQGGAIPYPNAEIARSFAAVIGIAATRDGVLWILDMGSPEQSPKLFGWHTRTNRLETVYYIPREASVGNSFFQDLAIDQTRKRAFIADMSRSDLVGESRPGIVVVDLETGAIRRRLDGHPYLQAQGEQRAEGQPMVFTGPDGVAQPLQLGLNPIGIDELDRYVYFSTIASGPVYRIAAATLGDPNLTDEEIADAIETFGNKPTSDGIAVAGETVYITDVDGSAIRALTVDGLTTVNDDPRLIWPDAIAIDGQGALVATVNQLNRAPPFNGGESGAEPPYLLVRIKP